MAEDHPRPGCANACTIRAQQDVVQLVVAALAGHCEIVVRAVVIERHADAFGLRLSERLQQKRKSVAGSRRIEIPGRGSGAHPVRGASPEDRREFASFAGRGPADEPR